MKKEKSKWIGINKAKLRRLERVSNYYSACLTMQDYRNVCKTIWPIYKYIYSPVVGLYLRKIYDVMTVTMVTPNTAEGTKK